MELIDCLKYHLLWIHYCGVRPMNNKFKYYQLYTILMSTFLVLNTLTLVIHLIAIRDMIVSDLISSLTIKRIKIILFFGIQEFIEATYVSTSHYLFIYKLYTMIKYRQEFDDLVWFPQSIIHQRLFDFEDE